MYEDRDHYRYRSANSSKSTGKPIQKLLRQQEIAAENLRQALENGE